jgi:hypothetical protein
MKLILAGLCLVILSPALLAQDNDDQGINMPDKPVSVEARQVSQTGKIAIAASATQTDEEILQSLDSIINELGTEIQQLEHQNEFVSEQKGLELSDLEEQNLLNQITLKKAERETGIAHGVGIDGEEEGIINTLDDSGLMDFEQEIDVWSEDVIEDSDDEDLL